MKKLLLSFLLTLCLSCSALAAEKIKILSFDGGGVRGIASLEILKKLQSDTKIDLYEDFDVFAGTSTGSIIALFLATGMPLDSLIDQYETMSSSVFSDKHFYHILQSEYGHDVLEAMILHTLESQGLGADSCLGDLLPKRVVIPTVVLDDNETGRWRVEILENNSEKGKKIKIVDAILESAAAPLYFPSYKGHIDGAVGMNDPSLAAVMETYDPDINDLKDLIVLSIGTGYEKHALSTDENWGAWQWFTKHEGGDAPPILTMILDVEEQIPEQACSKLLGKAYMRLNFPLTESFPLDDYKDIPKLITYTEDILNSQSEEWRDVCTWVLENFTAL